MFYILNILFIITLKTKFNILILLSKKISEYWKIFFALLKLTLFFCYFSNIFCVNPYIFVMLLAIVETSVAIYFNFWKSIYTFSVIHSKEYVSSSIYFRKDDFKITLFSICSCNFITFFFRILSLLI